MDLEIKHIIQQLSKAFTVQDIMTRREEMVTAKTAKEAYNISSKPDFPYDIIPLVSTDGNITGYSKKGESEGQSLNVRNILSVETGLIALPYLFEKQDFFFILECNQLVGYVHFSDLNNNIMKIPLFVLFETLERKMWQLIRKRTQEDDIQRVIKDSKRVKTILREHREMIKDNTDIGFSCILLFGEILDLTISFKIIDLPKKDAELLKQFRNMVAHVKDDVLIEKKGDINKLTRLIDISEQIIKILENKYK